MSQLESMLNTIRAHNTEGTYAAHIPGTYALAIEMLLEDAVTRQGLEDDTPAADDYIRLEGDGLQFHLPAYLDPAVIKEAEESVEEDKLGILKDHLIDYLGAITYEAEVKAYLSEVEVDLIYGLFHAENDTTIDDLDALISKDIPSESLAAFHTQIQEWITGTTSATLTVPDDISGGDAIMIVIGCALTSFAYSIEMALQQTLLVQYLKEIQEQLDV